MSALRNLYKIRDEKNEVVGIVTSVSRDGAQGKYHSNGGQAVAITIEKVSSGYPSDEVKIFR